MSARTTILIADDHPVFREGLRRVLEPQYTIVGDANESSDAVAKALEHKPAIVLMDLAMPGMGGIAATRAIREKLPDTKVIIVSASDDEEQILAAIEAGANGYVTKVDALQDVLYAIEHVAQGESYLPPSVAGLVMRGLAQLRSGGRTGRDHNRLTDREREVLKLLAQGLRNRDIGKALCISERTVGNHTASLYSKLGVADRAEAIVHAIRAGLVSI